MMPSAAFITAALSFAASAQALAIAGRDCTVKFTATGSLTGPVGQRENGQGILGEIAAQASFTLGSNTLVDAKGRGCWWTPPTKTLQCDPGQAPDAGFTVDCSGAVSFNGQTKFFQCSATDGTYNIYLGPNGLDCAEITLTAEGCRPSCPDTQPSSHTTQTTTTRLATAVHPATTAGPATSTASSATPSRSIPASVHKPEQPHPSATACPALPKLALEGQWEYPHLIIPVDSSKPDEAPATSFNGEVGSAISSLFNFDVPPAYDGKTCALVFHFPDEDQISETSSYTFSGSGDVAFARLADPAVQGTTSHNKQPEVETDLGVVRLAPGNTYTVATFDCPAGEAIGFRMAEASDADTHLWWFQDYNPAPIGLYMVVC